MDIGKDTWPVPCNDRSRPHLVMRVGGLDRDKAV